MKNLKTILLFSMCSLLLSGQPYGHRLYSHATSNLTSGVYTNINSSGFFMIGCQVPTASKPINFSIDKTNAGGVLSGASYIQRQYQILFTTNCIGPLIQATNGCAVSGIETNIAGSPAGWYAIAGTFDQSIFFATLDASGVPITQVEYRFPTYGWSSKPIIIESSTPNEYFITGSYSNNSIYALRVDAAGNILWSQIYDNPNINLMQTYDIVESPYNPEVLIVGHMVHPSPNPGRASDGFVLRLDVNNGNLNSFNTYGGPGGSCDSFQAIAVANSSTGGQGFVLIGSIDAYNCAGQAWIVKLDAAGNYIWTTEFMPASDPTTRRTVDVIERLNTSGAYEYYGVFQSNGTDMGVAKFDDFGAPFVGNNEFIYSQGASSPECISFVNTAGGPDEGIHIYGTDNSGTGDHYLVEAYFSGESGCNETLTQMSSCTGPSTFISPILNQIGNLTICTNFKLNPVLYDDYQANNICNVTSIPGASNARGANPTGIKEQLKTDLHLSVTPNPVINQAVMSYSLLKQSNVKIELLNYLGQHVKTLQAQDSKSSGDYKMNLDFNNYGIESGVYIIQFNIDNKVSHEKVVFSK